MESALRKVSHGSVKGKGQRLRAGGRLRGYRGVGVEATLPEAEPTTRGRSGVQTEQLQRGKHTEERALCLWWRAEKRPGDAEDQPSLASRAVLMLPVASTRHPQQHESISSQASELAS